MQVLAYSKYETKISEGGQGINPLQSFTLEPAACWFPKYLRSLLNAQGMRTITITNCYWIPMSSQIELTVKVYFFWNTDNVETRKMWHFILLCIMVANWWFFIIFQSWKSNLKHRKCVFSFKNLLEKNK